MLKSKNIRKTWNGTSPWTKIVPPKKGKGSKYNRVKFGRNCR